MMNRDTIVCISMAEKPGNFGATVFNTAFQELAMNYIYKPFLVRAEDLKNAVLGIRALGIRGCGVSMPHKMAVMQYLDEIDGAAQAIGAVNTIVNHAGTLIGYNTDFEGAKIVTRKDYDIRGKRVLIAGAGGAARAVIYAAKENQASEITLTNRNDGRGEKLADDFAIKYIPWNERNKVSGDLLVNATPVGMQKTDEPVFGTDVISQYEAVMDVVVSAQDTTLIRLAKELKKVALPGMRMSILQGIEQFKLYTTPVISETMVQKSIENFLKNNS